jgi:hypothetical protein
MSAQGSHKRRCEGRSANFRTPSDSGRIVAPRESAALCHERTSINARNILACGGGTLGYVAATSRQTPDLLDDIDRSKALDAHIPSGSVSHRRNMCNLLPGRGSSPMFPMGLV